MYLSLCQVGKREEWGKTICFSDQFLDKALIYLLPDFVITSPLSNICSTL